MSKRKPRRSRAEILTTAALGVLCLGGAATYTVMVGTSLISGPLPDASEEMDAVGIIRYETDPPQGVLHAEIDEGSAGGARYERSLICRGNAVLDPEACAVLGEHEDPFEETAPEAECADSEYGPESARITGHWEGTEVDVGLSRDGSCEEARWQRLRPLTEPVD